MAVTTKLDSSLNFYQVYLQDKVLNKLLTLVIVVFFYKISIAQIPVNYTLNDGLPSSETYRIAQDKEGFIWIATDRGVCRFDGYDFKTFTTKDGLPSNSFTDLYIDSKNRVWLIGRFSQAIYIYKGRIYKLETNDTSLGHLKGLQIIDIKEVNLDKILIVYHRKFVFAYYPSSGKFQKEFDYTEQERFKPFFQMIENGDLISSFGENDELKSRFDSSLTLELRMTNDSVKHFKVEEGIKLANKNIGCYKQYGDSILFLIKQTPHLYLLTEDSLKIIQSYPDDITAKFGTDANGDLWIPLFNNGIWLYKQGDYTAEPQKRLTNYTITSRLVDREGNVWHSTLSNGILFEPNERYQHLPVQSFGANQIKDIGGTDSSVFIITERGEIIDLKTRKPINLLAEHKISRVLGFGKKELLLSEKYGITLKYKPEENTLVNFLPVSAKVILQKEEDLYVAHNRKLVLIRDDKVFVNFREQFGFVSTVYSLTFYKGALYIGSEDGLYRYSNDTLTHLAYKHPLFKNRISGLINLSDSLLLISSLGSGLMFMKSEVDYYVVDESDGLSGNMLNGLHRTANNELMAYGSKGITVFFPPFIAPVRFESTTYLDGLGWSDVIGIYSYKDTLWAASRSGVTKWHKEDKTKPTYPPEIQIEQLLINNKPRAFSEPLVLAPKENNIILNFKSISYRSRQQISYEYRFVNQDSSWLSTPLTSVSFPKLPPDKYVFQLRAIDAWQQISDRYATIHITIMAPFWQQWWFIGLICLVTVAIVTGLFYWRLSALNQKIALLQQSYYSRHLTLNAQMNPHFIFNSLGAIKHYMLHHDRKLSVDYLSGFARLMRYILENGKAYLVSVENDLEALKEYVHLEQLRFPDRFQVFWELDDVLIKEQLQLPPMLLQPYIENAIQHGFSQKGDKGVLTISYRDHGKFFKLMVGDNGVGRKRTLTHSTEKKEHHSSGMAISKARVSLLNKLFTPAILLTVEDLENKETGKRGTRITFLIPKRLELKSSKQLLSND